MSFIGKATCALVGAMVVTNLTAVGLKRSRLHWNSTPSVPIGLYQETKSGSYAAICLTDAQLKEARAVGVRLSAGSCPNGVMPILKPLIVATPDQKVELAPQGFVIHADLLANTAPKVKSATGVILKHWPFGVYASGQWAISEYSPDSYDSRYLGPISQDQIQFKARPILTK